MRSITLITLVLVTGLSGLLIPDQVKADAQGLADGESITLDPNTGDYIVTYRGNGNQLLTAIFEPATKIDPMVYSGLTMGNGGLITYAYSLKNLASSSQALRRFQFVVSNIKARRSVHDTPGDNELPDSELLDRHDACQEALRAPTAWRKVCVDEDPNAPQGLKLGWTYFNRGSTQKGLAPGASIQGMGFDSFDLPGIVTGRLMGNSEEWRNEQDPSPRESDDYSLSEALDQQLIELEHADFVPRYLAAPAIEVSTPFNCTTLVGSLYYHIQGWAAAQLMEPALHTKVKGLLYTAINDCYNNSIARIAAVKPLNEIRVELRKKYPDLVISGIGTSANETLAEHDQRLAVQVLDFDVSYILSFLTGL